MYNNNNLVINNNNIVQFRYNNTDHIKIYYKDIKNIITYLKKHSILKFNMLEDITVVDYIQRKKRFEISYVLLSMFYNKRIIILTDVFEKIQVNSIINIHKAAGWLEREIWDLFGVFFKGHPDLRRMLTDYGSKGHPLRKEYPCIGFFDQNYYNWGKRVVKTLMTMLVPKLKIKNVNLFVRNFWTLNNLPLNIEKTKITYLVVHIESCSYYFLEKVLNNIRRDYGDVKVITSPNENKIFTVLKSPHINKKAREQFTQVHCKASFRMPIYVTAEELNKKLWNIIANSVGLTIKIATETK